MVAKNSQIKNTEKTVAMFFHSNQFRLPIKPQIVVSNTVIAYKTAVILLGIHITENLKLSPNSLIIIKSLKKVFSPYMLRSILEL